MHVNAGWEQRAKGKAICRWLVAWEPVSGTQVAGAVAGYSGGGTFVVERFVGTPEGDTFEALWIDFTDRMSGREIDFNSCGRKALATCEAALDMVWEWNDNEVWNDTDEVVLKPERADALTKRRDMLYLTSDTALWIGAACERAGLTAAPAT
jgi:hypothetical protein